MGSEYQIAPLILNVFVENAFKHSQAGQSDSIFIDIAIRLENGGQLTFICRNNYNPSPDSKDIPHGIGLENVKKRLKLLYPDAHQLTIDQQAQTYEVELLLRLNKA